MSSGDNFGTIMEAFFGILVFLVGLSLLISWATSVAVGG